MPNKRVMAVVSRGTGGPVDEKANTVIWEHEIPLLEEIHGQASVTVLRKDEDLLDDQDPKSRAAAIEKIKTTHQLGAAFSGRPKDEFDRLEAKYGMHPEFNMTVAAKVYGNHKSNTFIDALKNGVHPTEFVGEPDDIEEDVVEAPKSKKAA